MVSKQETKKKKEKEAKKRKKVYFYSNTHHMNVASGVCIYIVLCVFKAKRVFWNQQLFLKMKTTINHFIIEFPRPFCFNYSSRDYA